MALDRLLLFAKAPVSGRVKTRLTPPLPPDEAASLYDACLRDVFALCARERARVELWYDDERGAVAAFLDVHGDRRPALRDLEALRAAPGDPEEAAGRRRCGDDDRGQPVARTPTGDTTCALTANSLRSFHGPP